METQPCTTSADFDVTTLKFNVSHQKISRKIELFYFTLLINTYLSKRFSIGLFLRDTPIFTKSTKMENNPFTVRVTVATSLLS
jgi:hypothetical protein